MINKDDPSHAQQRKLVSSRFRLAALARHEDHVRRVVTELIDAVAPTGHAEVVADLAAPLPAIMISDLMGYDRAVWPQVKWWSEATMAQAGYLDSDERRPQGSEAASADFAAETLKLMEARRAEPRDDLMSVWVRASLDGDPFPVTEIFQEALLLIDGGAETTRSTIGQTVVALSNHPEQREHDHQRPRYSAHDRGGRVHPVVQPDTQHAADRDGRARAPWPAVAGRRRGALDVRGRQP